MFKKLELLLPPLPLTLALCGVIALFANVFPEFTVNIPFSFELAWACFLLGCGLVLPAALSFFQAKTTVDPRTPQKSKKLVVSGLYKISRNPMYVGFLFLLLGTSCFYQHSLGFIICVLFVPYMNRFQITVEEKQLSDSFGDEYIQYCQNVRRWL